MLCCYIYIYIYIYTHTHTHTHAHTHAHTRTHTHTIQHLKWIKTSSCPKTKMRSCLWTTLMNLFDPLQSLTTIYIYIYIMIFPPKNKNSLTKSPKICSLLYNPWNNMTSCICVHLMLKLFSIASVFCYFNSLQGILSLNSYQCLLFLLFNMLLNVFIFCNKFTCFLYEMQIVMITPREDKQNISSIVSLCYLSPNITPAQLFNARSSLYNARSDVLFNESISISASQCWSLSTANIWLIMSLVSNSSDVRDLKCVLHSRLPPVEGKLSSWETRKVTKMHCGLWRD